MTDAYLVFGIVEGQGDVEALPALLEHIAGWRLRLGKPPVYRLRSGLFLNNKEKRKKCFERVRFMAASALAAGQRGCVLILMDTDIMDKGENCCQKWLAGDQAAEILADIERVFAGIPSLLVLAEQEYESWLVAGLGGDDQGDPKKWLGENRTLWDKPASEGDVRPSKGYSSKVDQKIATSSPSFNIELAAKKSASFRRLRERLLKMAESG